MVALVYSFPAGHFGTSDSRVVVEEMETTETVMTLQAIVNDPPGPAQDFQMITLRSGRPALLIEYKGLGRVEFVDGSVLYDATGPALPTADAQNLANQVAAAAGA